MHVFQSFILGAVQGLTEFLPISSSGHLVLFPWLFKFQDPGLTFDVLLHFGTLFAILAYFWKDWLRLVRGFLSSFLWLRGLSSSLLSPSADRRLAWLLIIGCIPGALAGYFGEEFFEVLFRNPLSIAFMLAAFGGLLMWADRRGSKLREVSSIGLADALIIGCAQALALMPGVSRAGITITAGLFLGLKRPDAAKFSFLLSAPIIAGASLLKAKDIIGVGADNFVFLIVGFLAALISGFLAIKYLLKYLQTNNLNVFVYYRWVLAGAIVLLYFVRGL